MGNQGGCKAQNVNDHEVKNSRFLSREPGFKNNEAKEEKFSVKLGSVFPDFEFQSTEGRFRFHEFLEKDPAWTMFLSFPKAFAPVSTSEFAKLHGMVSEFKDLGVKLIGLTCDPVKELFAWSKDVLASKDLFASGLGFPLIGDENHTIATELDLMDPLERDNRGKTCPGNLLFLIGPDKTNRLSLLYPSTVGRSFAEVARSIRSLFLTQDFALATPVNWKAGERLIVAGSVETKEAERRFKNLEIKALPSGKQYLRYVDCPPTPASLVWLRSNAQLAPSRAYARTNFRIKLGSVFPDFDCKTTKGNFKFHKFLESQNSWTVLFSHPKDFTPVCTTELGECHQLQVDFGRMGVKLIGLSCDSVSEHNAWSKDVLSVRGLPGDSLDFPLIADENSKIASMLGMLDPLTSKKDEDMPVPARAMFLIDPEKRNRLTILYPATTGRNFQEVRRCLDSLFLTQAHHLMTPENWQPGERALVAPTLPTESAKAKFKNLETKVLPSGKQYLRYVDCPRSA